ncbi:enoyl-CoA hydratase/isomerase family protein [Denitratisoma oestradiolicum]|uniref:Enoyl-CoA hydratase/isomerase n=1 Tax=Denitratisoma oestradiolicum TaxID=311182 RepID=A0A6S6XVP6_9PROT|nr:enoyl-CoA hydratase-related protein [Denitratisoma oestradiolicum]TWO80328.1 enoyl-CoA hydratase [Denitratisoma oestradiolicum]CAB1370124.1 Enoyl-CoA hydratase/isomerase [Denitratisoma oestradiolicum]
MALTLPPTFTYEKRGRIALMTINRPEAMNSFTREMLVGMDAAFDDFNADPDLWVAVITGAGQKAFCAGMDLKDALPAIAGGDSMGYEDPAKRPFQQIYKPIIAAVNGVCIAGGLEFLQGMDIRIASENAIFGLGEVRWGVVPAGGTHIRLPQQIPWAVAMELLLTANNIDAKRAYDIGLINKIVPADKLMEEALAWAEKICQNGPLAVRTAKEIAVRALNNEPKFVLEKTMSARVFQSEDAKEGPRAFAEKRKPNYTGR